MTILAEKENAPKKPLTKTEQNLISELRIGDTPAIVRNPYSGEQVMLEPKAVALYDFIKGYEALLQTRKVSNIKKFDTARYLFHKLWPNSYMALLD